MDYYIRHFHTKTFSRLHGSCIRFFDFYFKNQFTVSRGNIINDIEVNNALIDLLVYWFIQLVVILSY